MRKWQHATIAVMLFGALIFCSTHSYAVSKDAYQNVFIEHLEMGPATYLNINAHGKIAADIDKRLTEIYHGNGLQPFWIEDEQARPACRRHSRRTGRCTKSWARSGQLFCRQDSPILGQQGYCRSGAAGYPSDIGHDALCGRSAGGPHGAARGRSRALCHRP